MISSRLARSLWCTLCLALVGLAAPRAVDAAELDDVLARFDRAQEGVRTLTAEFVETTHSAILEEPITARGRFFMTKPDSVRWEYTSPEEMRFVIAEDRYTGYFPEQKRAESRNIQRWSEQLFRFLGLGQTSEELKRFYEIGLGASEAGDGTYLLVLDPRKKRVRKRMEEVLLWIDRASYLPVRVRYTSSNGTTRDIEFDRMQSNPDLSAGLYRLEIPADVPVAAGFSALSGFGRSSK